MLFPLHPYNHDVPPQAYSLPGSTSWRYTTTNYGGTVADPWKITSQTPVSGAFSQRELSEMHDVETPGWRNLWLKGIATCSPYEREITTFNRGAGSYTVRRINRLGTSPNYYYSGFTHLGTYAVGDSESSTDWAYPSVPAVDNSIIAEAITECWAKVHLNDNLVLAQIWELNKSLGFLVDTFRRVWKIFRALRKFDLKALYGEIKPKELAQRYMEARYAIRPMAYDVRNTLKALADKCPARYATFRHYRESLASDEGTIICRAVAGDYRIDGHYTANRSMEVRVGVLTFVEAYDSAVRFGTFDIFQSAWEVIPFSFIVDWFWNVGKVIAAWSPKIGLKTLASWYVVKDITYLSVTAESGTSLKSGYNYTNTYSRTGDYSKTISKKYRIPNPDRPILPDCNIKLNNLKLLDLGVIAAGIYAAWTKKPIRRKGSSNKGYAWFDKDQQWYRE